MLARCPASERDAAGWIGRIGRNGTGGEPSRPQALAGLVAVAAAVAAAPPPPPPPPPRWRSLASFTLRLRPPRSLPSRARIASSAALASSISTKPKPRERPVSRSVITFTDSTLPWLSNRVRSSSSVVENERFPTYSFLLNSHSSPRPPLRGAATGAGLRTGLSGRWSPAAIDTARDTGRLAGARGRKRRTRKGHRTGGQSRKL